jgi:hypothetical protein
MVRAFVLFESEVDPEHYRRHIDDFASKVSCRAIRHGKIFGSPFGEPQFRQYAEFEWDDMESFKAGTNSEEFAASGADAMKMGVPFVVHFTELTEE